MHWPRQLDGLIAGANQEKSRCFAAAFLLFLFFLLFFFLARVKL
jgi:hypothetical protein